MSKEKKLIKNTLIYAVGNLGSKLLTFLLLPIYTKFLLESEFGRFDLIVNTIALILPIVTFQITDGIYRYILSEEDEEKIKSYISNGTIVVLKNLFIFSIIYFGVSIYTKLEYSLLIYLYFITSVAYTVLSQIVRGLKLNLDYALAGIIVTVITLGLNIFFIVGLGIGIEGLILSFIIAYIIACIYLAKKSKINKLISLKYKNKKISNQLCRFSIPLIPNVVSWWMMNVSDRFMITFFLGEALNGLYAIANKFSSIIVIINSFFSLAWQESAILEYESKDRDKYYTKMFNSYMRFQFTGMLVLLSVTKLGFMLLVKGSYFDGYTIVPILYMASIFSAFSVFYGTGYLSANDTKGSFYTTIIGAILNVVINIVAIPLVGVKGAAISTLISYLVVWILRVIQTKKYFVIKINIKDFLVLISLNIIFCILYYSNNLFINFAMIVIGTIVFYIYNKQIFNKIISFVIKKR